MKQRIDVISPVDGAVYVSIDMATPGQIARTLDQAQEAASTWRTTTVAERVDAVEAFVLALEKRKDEIAASLTMSMGRPSRYAAFEVSGTAERARYMASIAEASLADIRPDEKPGFDRYIRREPLGVVLVLSPWNYPYLTAVNAVIPAILSGNSVVLKHSDQTPLAAEHFKAAFEDAGLPSGVFQVLHMGHDATAQVLGDDCIDHVAFTGSVAGGAAISSTLAKRSGRKRFIGAGLELGGNDGAYVRADANLAQAAAGVIEGALFNSGQSCCGIERVYVHQDVADEFIDRAVAEAKSYVLGDPREPETTLGPMVRQRNADMVRAQITQALEAGAHPHIDSASFSADRADTAYLAPQVLTNVDHTMPLMAEETFGPCVGIMRVSNDAEAISRLNDSDYGLTGSIWTPDIEAARAIGNVLETGTVFLNRCDYLDPALAWTGVKNSGRGATLSSIGFEHLTRPKSFHFRTEVSS
jgi:acyl-CoA reductase-like NAD-dependent aldehyde dehydrogenase